MKKDGSLKESEYWNPIQQVAITGLKWDENVSRSHKRWVTLQLFEDIS